MATGVPDFLAQAHIAMASGDREVVASAVRESMKWFAGQLPGRAVELRVPPFLVVQVLGGTTHRRGTPPAVVEMAPHVWLGLICGEVAWADAIADGRISASGERSNLSEYFPFSN